MEGKGLNVEVALAGTLECVGKMRDEHRQKEERWEGAPLTSGETFHAKRWKLAPEERPGTWAPCSHPDRSSSARPWGGRKHGLNPGPGPLVSR